MGQRALHLTLKRSRMPCTCLFCVFNLLTCFSLVCFPSAPHETLGFFSFSCIFVFSIIEAIFMVNDYLLSVFIFVFLPFE